MSAHKGGLLSRFSRRGRKGKDSGSRGNASRGGGGTRATFGVTLKRAVMNNQSGDAFIPDVIRKATTYLEENNFVSREGLYRVPGSHARLNALKDAFDKGKTVDFSKPHMEDPMTVADLVTTFLRGLPESIFTNKLMQEFERATELTEPERMLTLSTLVFRLPLENKMTLKRIMEHLSRVLSHEDTNKMGIRNLTIVFTPSIKCSARVFALLLLRNGDIFEPECLECHNIIPISQHVERVPGHSDALACPACAQEIKSKMEVEDGMAGPSVAAASPHCLVGEVEPSPGMHRRKNPSSTDVTSSTTTNASSPSSPSSGAASPPSPTSPRVASATSPRERAGATSPRAGAVSPRVGTTSPRARSGATSPRAKDATASSPSPAKQAAASPASPSPTGRPASVRQSPGSAASPLSRVQAMTAEQQQSRESLDVDQLPKTQERQRSRPVVSLGRSTSSDTVVFGAPLSIVCKRTTSSILLPSPFRKCLSYLDGVGLHYEELYRQPGDVSRVKRLVTAFDSQTSVDMLALLEGLDVTTAVHTVTMLMKLYLRQLPEPLFGRDTLPLLTLALKGITNERETVDHMAYLISKLPLESKTMLLHLFSHLRAIVKQQEANKMSIQRLATVFSTILQCPPGLIVFVYNHRRAILQPDCVGCRKMIPLDKCIMLDKGLLYCESCHNKQ